MVRKHMGLEGGEESGQDFEAEAKLLGPLNLALPAVVGGDRAVDLHTGSESAGDDVGGEAIGFVASGDSGPAK